MNIHPTAPKMLTPDQLDRRTILKGVTLGAGAVVLQPFLNALAAEQAGQAPPKRFIFFIQGNGLWNYHVQPKGVEIGKGEQLIDRSLSDLELPEPIDPLTPFKNRMAIIQKLSHKISGGGDHGKGYGGLGCYHWRRGPIGPTIDQTLAAAQPSIVPVVGLGVPGGTGAVIINSVSASAARRPTPMVCQPDLAFQMLFGSVAEGDAGKVFQARNKLLDWCRSDIKHVREELPAMDREKLDVYLDAFEQMRARQSRIDENRERLRANLPTIDRFDSKRATQRFEAQCEIAAAAITSGLTNVVTIDANGALQPTHHWHDLGVKIDDHAIGHLHGQAGTPAREQHAVPIRRFHAERVADLARRLDAVKEGNGTILDNTLIIWMSDSGEEHHGFCSEWPLVLVGGLAGKLKTAGRFLQFPKYQSAGHRTIANFYLSLLHAVGDKRKSFGEIDPALEGLRDVNQAGVLEEIMA